MPPAVPARPADTAADADRVQVELFRAAPAGRRLRLAFSLSATVISIARRGLARSFPGDSPPQQALRFVELHYGRELADGLRADLDRRTAAGPFGA